MLLVHNDFSKEITNILRKVGSNVINLTKRHQIK